MDEAAEVLEAALAADPGVPELRAELAQTWHQLAQVLDQYVGTNAETDDEDLDDDAGAADDGPGAKPLSGAEIEALRLEEIELWGRAAGTYATLGPDHLHDRFQCVNNAAWTEQERGRAEAGAALVSALIDEFRALPEDAVPDWLMPAAERLVSQLMA